MAADGDNKHRLPATVTPDHYDVYIHLAGAPDEPNTPFRGLVAVRLLATAESATLTLHSNELEWGAGDVELREIVDDAERGEEVPVEGVDFDAEAETATVRCGRPLRAGAAYELRVAYTGLVNDKLAGFYRSTYTAADGASRKAMAVTQFEATDARRALPCWDEPALKATFGVTIYSPAALDTLSNMPERERSTVTAAVLEADPVARALGVDGAAAGTVVRRRFETSPRMSTYLLAFCVGEFDHISARTSRGVDVRVYVPLGKAGLGAFALRTAVRAIEFFEEHFGQPYQLPKADLVCCEDFAAGAMENWGLVTYRATRLLIDERRSSAEAKMRTARTICHEIAHSWFGNQVTFEWWSQLWLNEGFARAHEFLAVDSIYPEWEVFTSYLSDVHELALGLDALASSHPVEVEVRHPSEINEIFDAISYAKGSSVLRMVSAYVGPDKFRDGVRAYLKRFAYANATSAQLWEEIGRAAGEPGLADMLDAWLHRTGYPVLTVEEEADAHAHRLRVSQQRFLSSGGGGGGGGGDGDDDGDGGAAEPWTVPVVVAWHDEATGTSGTSRHVVDRRVQTLEVEAPPGAVLRLNPDHAGFFRVRYSQPMMGALCRLLDAGALAERDRLGLASDASAVAAAGLAPAGYLLDLLAHYRGETNLPVVSTVADALRGVAAAHRGEPHYPALQRLVRRQFAPLLERLGWEGDAADDRLRAAALSMLGLAGDEEVGREAVRRVLAGEAGAADVRGTVYTAAVRAGGEPAWRCVMELLERGDLMPEEELRLMSAVGRTPEPDLQRRTLEWALSPSVRLGNLPYAMASLCGTPAGRDLCWAHVTEHFDEFTARFDGVGFLAGSVFGSIVGAARSAADADAMEAFFREHPCPQAARKISQALERVRAKAARSDRERDDVARYLAGVGEE